MFAVVYTFEVHPGQAEAFVSAWRDLTVLIRDHEGSLGSRLHRQDDVTFVAYAQWPDRARWEGSGDRLPPEAEGVRARMRAACAAIDTAFELDLVDDLLVPVPQDG